MNDDIFLNRTFRAYKSNTIIPRLTSDQVSLITRSVAKALLTRYRNENNDLIPKYQNHEEILYELELIDREKHHASYSIRYIHLQHPDTSLLARQTVIFITDPASSRDYNTLVLNKVAQSQGNISLLSLLQQLEFQEDLIVKDYNAGHDFVKNTINELFQIVASLPRTYIEEFSGDIQLVYAHKAGSINSNLKHIVIDVPKADVTKFDRGEGPYLLIDLINEFLHHSSSINFDKLSITKFTSSIIQISIDGKLRIAKDCVDAFDDVLQSTSGSHHQTTSTSHPVVKDRSSLIWFILESIYNAF